MSIYSMSLNIHSLNKHADTYQHLVESLAARQQEHHDLDNGILVSVSVVFGFCTCDGDDSLTSLQCHSALDAGKMMAVEQPCRN